ncbi:MAG: hypothetical protein AAF560_26395, partial [Acidobacteriota bacterium]
MKIRPRFSGFLGLLLVPVLCLGCGAETPPSLESPRKQSSREQPPSGPSAPPSPLVDEALAAKIAGIEALYDAGSYAEG